MKNRYEIRGPATVIYCSGAGLVDAETLIDTADLAKASSFPNTWYVMRAYGLYYVRGEMTRRGKRHIILLHRVITGAPENLVVDHINHNGLDNRRLNLRVVTSQQNLQNRSGPQVDNTTGARGVTWAKDRRRYVAQVKARGRNIHLGIFKSLEEAAEVAKRARRKHLPYANGQ